MTRSACATSSAPWRSLQWAIELEHATLPPYLCALYSLDPERNPEAVHVVASVFAEEMLHLALAANLLNAVGGRPRLDVPEMLPPHPRPLPHGDRSLQLSLVPFGPEAIEAFLRIEKPAPPGAPPEDDAYETIGQFYDAVEEGLRGLCDRLGEDAVFSGDPARQVTSAHFRNSAGRLFAVTGLTSALAALEEIVEQGEGTARGEVWDGDRDVFHPERDEVAHYYRFQELKAGRRYRRGDTPESGPTGEPVAVDFGGVRPMRRNPRLADHPPGSEIRAAQEEFNRTYCGILHLLELAFDGSPGMLPVAVGTMYALKAQAEALMSMPDEGGTTAGPTFEYVPKEARGWSKGEERRVVVLRDGPYIVYGGIPLRRKRKIVSSEGDALTWPGRGAVHPRGALHLPHPADRRDARRHRRQRRPRRDHGADRPLPVRLLQLRPAARRRDDRGRPAAGGLRPRGGGRPAAGDPQPRDAVPLRPLGEQAAVRRHPPGDRLPR